MTLVYLRLPHPINVEKKKLLTGMKGRGIKKYAHMHTGMHMFDVNAVAD